MNRKLKLVIATLALTVGFSSAAAYAQDTFDFTVNNPNQTIGATGGELDYFGTVTAPASNTDTFYLNADAPNFGNYPGITFDDSPFLGSYAFSLAPGATYSGELFSLTFASGAGLGRYAGSFAILGGEDNGTFSDFDQIGNTGNFSATVTPEPSSFLLLGSGLAGLVGVVRRKRSM